MAHQNISNEYLMSQSLKLKKTHNNSNAVTFYKCHTIGKILPIGALPTLRRNISLKVE